VVGARDDGAAIGARDDGGTGMDLRFGAAAGVKNTRPPLETNRRWELRPAPPKPYITTKSFAQRATTMFVRSRFSAQCHGEHILDIRSR
jgi:hypothetical protein